MPVVRPASPGLALALLLAGCGGGGDSPHRVYAMLGFHGNFYHSWRGDTPDEAGDAAGELPLALKLRLFRAGLAHGWATR